MKNIAIVGCGNMGGGHALAIGYGTGYTDWQLPQIIDDEIEAVTTDISKILHLSGIFDIDEKRQEWARSQGFHVYQSLEEILDDPEVDIVLVAVPNHLHAEIAIKAMRAGKHVLCEKPVTPTSAGGPAGFQGDRKGFLPPAEPEMGPRLSGGQKNL